MSYNGAIKQGRFGRLLGAKASVSFNLFYKKALSTDGLPIFLVT